MEIRKRNAKDSKPTKDVVGLVMPISGIGDYTEQHWKDVKQILVEAVCSAGFDKPELVSDADDVGIIQKRIIQNLYSNAIVVCDVSGKNPNVMFELGMRLAFDKPTIIIKDDQTSYSFDTSPIEHLTYPRDLRFNTIVGFKEQLADKLKGTLNKSKEDSSYTTFLKHFGTFTVPKLDTEEVSKEEYIIEQISELGRQIQTLSTRLTTEQQREPVDLSSSPRMEARRRFSALPEIIRNESTGVNTAGNVASTRTAPPPPPVPPPPLPSRPVRPVVTSRDPESSSRNK